MVGVGVLRRWLSGKEECRWAVRANTLEAGVCSDDILQLFEKLIYFLPLFLGAIILDMSHMPQMQGQRFCVLWSQIKLMLINPGEVNWAERPGSLSSSAHPISWFCFVDSNEFVPLLLIVVFLGTLTQGPCMTYWWVHWTLSIQLDSLVHTCLPFRRQYWTCCEWLFALNNPM